LARRLGFEEDLITARDNSGDTLLHLAAEYPSVEIMRALLDFEDLEAKSLAVSNRNNKSLLSIALQNQDMLRFQIERIEQLSAEGNDTPSSNGDGDWADLATVTTLLEAIPNQSSDEESEPNDKEFKQHSADREILQKLFSLISESGPWNTAKHGRVLRLAAQKGVSGIVERLVKLPVGKDEYGPFEE
jgi:ankyrin repeat protein